MKHLPLTLLFVFGFLLSKAQQRHSDSPRFRYMSIWSCMAGSAIPGHGQPAIAIDSASGVITIRVIDPQVSETLRIYTLTGNVLFERPLETGNNIITLTGLLPTQTFIFCVEHDGSSQYSMKIARL